MHRVLSQVVILAALLPGALSATSLRLCLEDRAGVSVAARAEFLVELIRLLPEAKLSSDEDCADDESAVRIALAKNLAGHPADVLGAIRIQPDGRVAPPALVFVDAVAAYSKAPGERALGRALARVAGHELMHYLQQAADHAEHGLMQDRLSAQDLTRVSHSPSWRMAGRLAR